LFSAFSIGYRFAQLEKPATYQVARQLPTFRNPDTPETAVEQSLLASSATRAALAKREFARHLALLS